MAIERLARLRRRCPYAARVLYREIEAEGSWRVGRLATLLDALWGAVPPRGRRLRRRWYVAEAYARATLPRVAELLRAASERFPSSERTVERDLAKLRDLGLIVRAPGEAHPYGRHADTLHLVGTAEEASWWAETGRARIAASPDAARKARVWYALVGDWRAEARSAIVESPGTREEGTSVSYRSGRPTPSRSPLPPSERIEELRAGIESGSRRRLLQALWRCGVRFGRAWRWRFARTFDRAAAAVALLLQRIEAVGWPRSLAGWLVWAWKEGGGAASRALHELRKAAEPPPEADLGLDLASLCALPAVAPEDVELEAVRAALGR